MALTVSALKGTDNNFETTSEMFNAPMTDFGSEGVVGAITNTSGVAPMTGAFAVNAQGTPDMTVAVTAGIAYVTATPSSQASQMLRVDLDANDNVTINANSSGATRYDWVYISINATNADAPNSTGTNVATLVTSRSTSASSDDGTPPTYGYPIAVVTVANGASSITNANISDSRANAGVEPADDSVTPAKMGLAKTDFSPTYSASGSLTFTSVTSTAHYIDLGNFFYIMVVGTGTTGGTTSNSININTLPFTAAADNAPLACTITDGTTQAGLAVNDGSNNILVRKYDSSNWGLGAGRAVRVSGILRKA